MPFLSVVRLVLYYWMFAAALLGLTAVRLHYTENLSPNDPLNGGHHFYDPIVVELFVASTLSVLWSTFAIHAIWMRWNRLVIHTFAVEAIALSMLFTMWLVGTALATTGWGHLGWCHQYSPCRVLSALVGVAWAGWVFLFFLLDVCLVHTFITRAWNEPIHGHLYPRNSLVLAQTSEHRGSGL